MLVIMQLLPNYFKTLGEGPVREKSPVKGIDPLTLSLSLSLLLQTLREMDRLTVEETRDLMMSVMFVLKHLDNGTTVLMHMNNKLTFVCVLVVWVCIQLLQY